MKWLGVRLQFVLGLLWLGELDRRRHLLPQIGVCNGNERTGIDEKCLFGPASHASRRIPTCVGLQRTRSAGQPLRYQCGGLVPLCPLAPLKTGGMRSLSFSPARGPTGSKVPHPIPSTSSQGPSTIPPVWYRTTPKMVEQFDPTGTIVPRHSKRFGHQTTLRTYQARSIT